jgi:hypothetical protein
MTPAVLTVDLRSVEHGWDFHWKAFASKPTWVKPDGTHVPIKVKGYIPYVEDKEDNLICAAPAASSSSNSSEVCS